MYLVDTDWIIDHLRGKEEVKEKLKELRPSGIAISIVSLAELYEGIYSSKDPIKDQNILENLLTQFFILEIEEDICKVFGKERGRLRQQRKTVGDFDLLIASNCLHYNLTILTNNRKHYEVVNGLNIVSLLDEE
jgi:tRNA(fMet)-specific endonuclease VapC